LLLLPHPHARMPAPRLAPHNTRLLVCTACPCCPKIYDWDFDVFKFSQACQGRPLQPLVLELLEREGLLVSARVCLCACAA
jgi:hypothetical protein